MLRLLNGEWTTNMDEVYAHLIEVHFPGSKTITSTQGILTQGFADDGVALIARKILSTICEIMQRIFHGVEEEVLQRCRCRNIKREPQIFGSIHIPRPRPLFPWVWFYGGPWQTPGACQI